MASRRTSQQHSTTTENCCPMMVTVMVGHVGMSVVI